MSVSSSVAKFGLTKAFDHLNKDPEANLVKLIDWADRFSNGRFPTQRAAIREAIEDPENAFYPYVRHIINDVDPEVMKTLAINFFINANLVGIPLQNELAEKYQCNVPLAILLDPTSACNLHCIGCWAADYGNRLNLSFEEMDDIICQGKELGVYFYLFSGGEPLVRKKDIIRLCEKHGDCMFTAFTNGTLIDEEFADEMLRVKNFAPAISLEGFREATDSRRGEGVYDKVLEAMKILHDRKLIYGISCCYTSVNYDSITSEEYWDMLIENAHTSSGISTTCPWETMPRLSCCPRQSRESWYSTEFGITGIRSRSSPSTSKTMANSSEVALRAERNTSISMPMAMQSRALSSITPIPTYARSVCWTLCSLRSSWPTMTDSLSTRT
ncbi:MAG: radical SAM protein [Coriobacteriales bacterium]|nr:radical SAM protein [Coriobacteriales bacterium]